MPIITKKGLPVNDILREEKIQILDELADGCSNSKEILQIAKNAKIIFSENTVIGALAKYISTPNKKFQPMNANFGILPELEGKKIKDKKERYMKLAERSLKEFKS